MKDVFGNEIKSIFDVEQPSKNDKLERDSKRGFTKTQKDEILFQQDNRCAQCHKKLDPRDIEFDHKKPWASGGRTKTVNGRAVCGSCHNIITHRQRLNTAEVPVKKVVKKALDTASDVIGNNVKIPEFSIPQFDVPNLVDLNNNGSKKRKQKQKDEIHNIFGKW